MDDSQFRYGRSPIGAAGWLTVVCDTQCFRLYNDVHSIVGPIPVRLWRGDAAQCIDRVFSSTGSVQQQEASHNAEVFIETVHAVDSIGTFHCPIAMSDKRSSQRVKKHEHGRKTRERANGDREPHRKFHERRNGSSQYRHRNAKLYHLTYGARIVLQLSAAENQKQYREKKTGRKNELVVDVVCHNATLAPCFPVAMTAHWA